MSVLAKTILLERLRDTTDFFVTPILDENQIGPSSIDIRLHKEFIIFRKSQRESVNLHISDKAAWRVALHEFQERVRFSFNDQFVLHPGELVLGGSLEYISLPTNVFATVEGKSTLGRLGLIIATATSISPGFKGCITLEIVNEGEIPIVVKPGQLIGQLVFWETKGEGAYDGKYLHPIGPQYAVI